MSTLANLTEVLFRLDFDPDTAVYHYRGPLHCINLRTSAEVQESLQVLATQGLFLSLMFCRGPLRSAYSRDF
ncbi:hypothetical protein AB8P97_21945 [Pseudomonas aeruginosa]|nr:hypothetical protein [Pseudomonas aeruginosa]HCH6958846.1 hypothetical protein [Pseudomonas aeruginosa]